MSVIVAVSDGKRVCMVADTQGTMGDVRLHMATPKLARLGSVLVGMSGDMRFTNVVSGLRPARGTLLQVAERLAAETRKALQSASQVKRGHTGDEVPGQCLVARGREFLLIDASGAVIQLRDRWWAIGAGGPEARGALHAYYSTATRDKGKPTRSETQDMAHNAVMAACHLCTSCGYPFVSEWTR